MRQPITSPSAPAAVRPMSWPSTAPAEKRAKATGRSAGAVVSPSIASPSGMMPPAASPARTRAANSSDSDSASAEANSPRASSQKHTLNTAGLPTASPSGPRIGWLRPKGRVKADDRSATMCVEAEKSRAIEVTSGSR